jgi:predicted HTH transcriptional regulator
LFGSTLIDAAFEGAAMIERTGTSSVNATISGKFFEQGVKDYDINFAIKDGEYDVSVDENEPEYEGTEDEILEFVMDNPGARPADIVEGSGVAKSTLYRKLKKLVDSGELKKQGTKYFIPMRLDM